MSLLRRPLLRPVALAVLTLASASALALPQGAKPVFGQTRVTQTDGSTMLIEQSSARAGIDWTSFSIGAGETVRIQQPDAQSVLYNRVTGLDPSVVLGRLQANGRVFLTNPRGVIFGAGAQVDVGGLVATTLNLSDANAQAGRWWLSGGGDAAVVNEGRLSAPGGTVALVAPQVRNSGDISAGRVALGAVSEVQIDLDGDGLVLLNARAADAARLDQLGRVQATSRAEFIAAARGEIAGTVLNLRGAVASRGLRGEGGEIVIDGGPAGITEVGATVDASATQGRGGDIRVLGQNVLLDSGAQLDARGPEGGGRIRVGGGWQGSDAALRNSERLVVRPGATLDASATAHGDGGEVVLWSDQRTRYFGDLKADGGPQGGDGGRAEVSGKHTLEFAGSASLRAPRGSTGLLLLDPLDIVIDSDANATAAATPAVGFLDDAAGSPVFAASQVSTLLQSADVELQALNDITVVAGNPVSGTHRLTLRAGNDIAINAAISTQGLTLSANDPGGSGSGFGKVTVNARLDAGAADLVIDNNGSSGVHFLGADLAGSRLTLGGNALLTAPQRWTFSDAVSGSFASGSLGGSDTLTLDGPGVTTLTGNNAGLAGGIALDAGRLVLAGSNDAGGGGALTVASGARLDLAGISLSVAPVLQAGATAGADNSAGADFANGLVLAGNATLDGRNGDVLVGPVTQTGGARTLNTLGTVTLTSTSQAAQLVVGGGVLDVAGTLQGSPTLQADGGTLRLSGAQTVGALNAGAAGTVDLAAGTLTVTGGGSFDGTLQGSGNLVLQGGTLVAANPASLGSGPALAVAVGGTLQLGSGSLARPLVLAGSGASGQGALLVTGTVAGGGAWTLSNDATVAVSGSLSQTAGIGESRGGSNLIKAGTGTLTLGGTAAWTGGTTVSAGTLVAAGGNALPDTGVTIAAGSTLQLAANETVGTLGGAGNVALGANTLTVGGGSFGGSIAGSGSLVVAGGTLQLLAPERLADTLAVVVQAPATLALAGTETLGSLQLGGTLGGSGRLVAGGVVLSGGTVGSGVAVAAPVSSSGNGTLQGTAEGDVQVTAGTLTLGSAERIADTATLQVGSNAFVQLGGNETVGTLGGSGTVLLGSATLATRGSSTFAGSLSGPGTLRVEGGTLRLAGSNGHGATQVAAGVLVVGDGASAGSLGTGPVTVDGVLRFDRGDAVNISNTIGGSGLVQFTGNGRSTLTQPGTWTGGTEVLAGTLALPSAVAPGTGSVRVATGGTLELGSAVAFTNALLLDGGTLAAPGGAAVDGSVTLLADSTLDGSGLVVNGSIGDVGIGFGLTTRGSVTFTADNTYIGRTTVASGTLDVGTGGATGSVGFGPITINGTLHLARSNLVTVDNPFDGSGTLVLDVPGGVTLTGGGAFTGSTQLDTGTLAVSGAAAGTGSGTITLQPGTVLDIADGATVDASVVSLGGSVTNSSGAGTLAGTLALQADSTLASSAAGLRITGAVGGAAGFTKTGTGRVELAGANTFAGAATVSTGTLAATSSNALGGTASGTSVQTGATLDVGAPLAAEPITLAGGTLTGTGRVAGAVTLAADSTLAGSVTVDGVIGGSAALATTGTVTLNGANTFTGRTTVGSGTLTLGNSAALGASAVTVAGGTLDVGSTDAVVPGLQLLAGQVSGSSGSLASATAFDLQGGSVNAVLAGSSGLVKSGSGATAMNTAATYTGTTTINAGSLILTAPERLPDGSAVTIAPAGTLALGGNETVASLTLQGTLAPTGTLTAASYQLQGGTAFANLGAGTLVNSGNGRIDGTAAVTSIDVASGILTLASAGRLTAAPAVTLAAGSTLAPVGDEAVGALTGSGSVALAGARLSTGGNADFVFDGQFTGSGGFAKTGNGVMTLTAAQGFTGTVDVQGGTLRLPAAERLPDGSALTIGNAGTLQLAGGDETVASATIAGRLLGPGRLNAGLYALAGGTVDTDLGAGTLTSTGNSRLNGTAAAATVDVLSGTLTLGAAERLSASAAVSVQPTATLALGGNQTVQTLALAGTLTGTGTFTAPGGYQLDAGSRVDVPLGAGTLTVDGNSTLNQTAGATVVNVNGGTLTVAGGGDLSDQATVNVAGGGTLAVTSTQTVATLNLAGNVSGSGTLAVGTLATDGTAAVQTTVQVATPVTVTTGTLTVGDGSTGGALVAPSTSVAEGATLAYNRSDTVAVGSIGGSGALRQDGTGTLQLTGNVSGLQAVQVGAGNLALAGGNQIGDSAAVSVAANGTLTLAAGGETVGTLDLAGRLAGTGATLNAGLYTLAGGTVDANLGAGTLANTGGTSVISGTVGAGNVAVSGGSLAVAGSQALLARPVLDVQSGATLTLAGTQVVGAVTNAGTLVTGSLLDATSVASPGAVRIGGTISTTGGQSYGGALTSAVAAPQLVAGGDIVALSSSNDLNGATLAVQARSLQLYGGGAELRLGAVTLGADSSITAAGRLVLAGATRLDGGRLVLQALGTPGDGSAVMSTANQQALLPDPVNGAASGTRLVYATPVIQQTADGTLVTAEGTALLLRAPGGGSIELGQAGNRFGGTVSAVSGPAGGGFTLGTGAATLRLSRVWLNADALQFAADDADAVRADVVQLRAARISTAPGAWIRARLPYSVNQGAGTSAAGLVIDTGMAPAGGSYGSTGSPLAVAVAPSSLGLGGLLLSVWPEPAAGGAAAQRLYLGCNGCANPVYLFGGEPLAAQAYFNGSVLGSAPQAASVVNNSTSLLENARRTLFEGAVRTENVAPRLRAGVIAEVGAGRPAVEGRGTARRPALCDGKDGTLDC